LMRVYGKIWGRRIIDPSAPENQNLRNRVTVQEVAGELELVHRLRNAVQGLAVDSRILGHEVRGDLLAFGLLGRAALVERVSEVDDVQRVARSLLDRVAEVTHGQAVVAAEHAR